MKKQYKYYLNIFIFLLGPSWLVASVQPSKQQPDPQRQLELYRRSIEDKLVFVKQDIEKIECLPSLLERPNKKWEREDLSIINTWSIAFLKAFDIAHRYLCDQLRTLREKKQAVLDMIKRSEQQVDDKRILMPSSDAKDNQVSKSGYYRLSARERKFLNLLIRSKKQEVKQLKEQIQDVREECEQVQNIILELLDFRLQSLTIGKMNYRWGALYLQLQEWDRITAYKKSEQQQAAKKRILQYRAEFKDRQQIAKEVSEILQKEWLVHGIKDSKQGRSSYTDWCTTQVIAFPDKATQIYQQRLKNFTPSLDKLFTFWYQKESLSTFVRKRRKPLYLVPNSPKSNIIYTNLLKTANEILNKDATWRQLLQEKILPRLEDKKKGEERNKVYCLANIEQDKYQVLYRESLESIKEASKALVENNKAQKKLLQQQNALQDFLNKIQEYPVVLEVTEKSTPEMLNRDDTYNKTCLGILEEMYRIQWKLTILKQEQKNMQKLITKLQAQATHQSKTMIDFLFMISEKITYLFTVQNKNAPNDTETKKKEIQVIIVAPIRYYYIEDIAANFCSSFGDKHQLTYSLEGKRYEEKKLREALEQDIERLQKNIAGNKNTPFAYSETTQEYIRVNKNNRDSLILSSLKKQQTDTIIARLCFLKKYIVHIKNQIARQKDHLTFLQYEVSRKDQEDLPHQDKKLKKGQQAKKRVPSTDDNNKEDTDSDSSNSDDEEDDKKEDDDEEDPTQDLEKKSVDPVTSISRYEEQEATVALLKSLIERYEIMLVNFETELISLTLQKQMLKRKMPMPREVALFDFYQQAYTRSEIQKAVKGLIEKQDAIVAEARSFQERITTLREKAELNVIIAHTSSLQKLISIESDILTSSLTTCSFDMKLINMRLKDLEHIIERRRQRAQALGLMTRVILSYASSYTFKAAQMIVVTCTGPFAIVLLPATPLLIRATQAVIEDIGVKAVEDLVMNGGSMQGLQEDFCRKDTFMRAAKTGFTMIGTQAVFKIIPLAGQRLIPDKIQESVQSIAQKVPLKNVAKHFCSRFASDMVGMVVGDAVDTAIGYFTHKPSHLTQSYKLSEKEAENLEQQTTKPFTSLLPRCKHAFLDALLYSMAATVTEKIGDTYGEHKITQEGQQATWSVYCTHKVAHGIVGGAHAIGSAYLQARQEGGCLRAADLKKAFQAGCLGAVMGEVITEAYLNKIIIPALEGAHDNMSEKEFADFYQKQIERAAAMGKLGSISSAYILEADIVVAYQAADQAIENNFLGTAFFIGMTAWTIYDICKTIQEGVKIYQNEGKEAALKFAIKQISIEILSRILAWGAFKVVGKLLKTAAGKRFTKELMTHVGEMDKKAGIKIIKTETQFLEKKIIEKGGTKVVQGLEKEVINKGGKKVVEGLEKKTANKATKKFCEKSGKKGVNKGTTQACKRKSQQLAQNRAKGKAGEKLANITEPKKRIEYNNRYIIPDKVTDKILIEVKNVKRLSYTKQIRTYQSFAESKGLDFVLKVTDKNTYLTKPLKEQIKKGKIILEFLK
ncbi:MAG: putative toxin [Bacteroidota bacterium]